MSLYSCGTIRDCIESSACYFTHSFNDYTKKCSPKFVSASNNAHNSKPIYQHWFHALTKNERKPVGCFALSTRFSDSFCFVFFLVSCITTQIAATTYSAVMSAYTSKAILVEVVP